MTATPQAEDFFVREFYDVPRVEIRGAIDPLSLQADGARKKAFKTALSTAVRDATVGVHTHDVEVTLTWFIEESRRYQTHLVADLDNVMKPILDAVTGPDGVLIDDNQVQSIKACWMTPGINGPGFELCFEPLLTDDYIKRAGLSFVEFSRDRCYPLHGALVEADSANSAVSAWRRALRLYSELQANGVPASDARAVLPAMRPFPLARLSLYTVRHESEFPEPDSAP